MEILIFIIGICLLIALCSSGNNSTSSTNNSNLTLDVDRMYKDSVGVTLGRLSKSEYKKRQKSGYYMVQKGKEYSQIDELKKKRVEKITKDWIY